MRTGLITFHFAHHYGAQLQALATMRAIQSLGHDCEIIDYRLPHTTRTNQLFKKSGGVRGMASDAHTALHYGAFQRRFRRFEAFVAEEMALSPRAVHRLRAAPGRPAGLRRVCGGQRPDLEPLYLPGQAV